VELPRGRAGGRRLRVARSARARAALGFLTPPAHAHGHARARIMLDAPLIILGPAIVVLLSGTALIGLWLVRRFVLPRLRITEGDSEFSGAIVQSVMVFYGLALALIAVNVWQTYNDVAHTVSMEAITFATLYRDVSGYPEPVRSRLQGEIRGYVDQIIHGAWPIMRKGQVPTEGVLWMDRVEAELVAFEPGSDGQRVLHAETLAAFNRANQARRMRVDATHTGLPGVMWMVIVVGAVISISACYFFRVEDARLHGILVVLLAVLIGLVILMTVSMNHPFRGDLGLSAEPYQLVYDQLMKP
jgi:hypothetical protein